MMDKGDEVPQHFTKIRRLPSTNRSPCLNNGMERKVAAFAIASHHVLYQLLPSAFRVAPGP